MVGADGEVGRRRPRLDLLVRAMGEDPVRETLDSTFASGVKTDAFTTSPTKPGKTRSVSIGIGNGQLVIGWQAPDSDGGSAITAYKVQWKSGSQSFGGDPSREPLRGDGHQPGFGRGLAAE